MNNHMTEKYTKNVVLTRKHEKSKIPWGEAGLVDILYGSSDVCLMES